MLGVGGSWPCLALFGMSVDRFSVLSHRWSSQHDVPACSLRDSRPIQTDPTGSLVIPAPHQFPDGIGPPPSICALSPIIPLLKLHQCKNTMSATVCKCQLEYVKVKSLPLSMNVNSHKSNTKIEYLLQLTFVDCSIQKGSSAIVCQCNNPFRHFIC